MTKKKKPCNIFAVLHIQYSNLSKINFTFHCIRINENKVVIYHWSTYYLFLSNKISSLAVACLPASCSCLMGQGSSHVRSPRDVIMHRADLIHQCSPSLVVLCQLLCILQGDSEPLETFPNHIQPSEVGPILKPLPAHICCIK